MYDMFSLYGFSLCIWLTKVLIELFSTFFTPYGRYEINEYEGRSFNSFILIPINVIAHSQRLPLTLYSPVHFSSPDRSCSDGEYGSWGSSTTFYFSLNSWTSANFLPFLHCHKLSKDVLVDDSLCFGTYITFDSTSYKLYQ